MLIISILYSSAWSIMHYVVFCAQNQRSYVCKTTCNALQMLHVGELEEAKVRDNDE